MIQRASCPQPFNRREFLWRSGGGLGGIARRTCSAPRGCSRPTCREAARRPQRRAAPPAQGEAGRAALHVGRGQPVRHVRLQAALDQEARREVRSGRQGRAVPERAGRRDEEPLGVAAVRRVRQVDQRPGAAPGRLRRRHGVHASRWSSKSNVHGPATFMQNTGLRAAGLPEHGGVGLVRAGEPEREPADVRRPARLARASPPTGRRTGARASCRRRTRGRWSAPAPKNPIVDLFPPEEAELDRREPSATASRCSNRLNREHQRRPRGRLAARRADRLVRAGRPAAAQRARGARPRRARRRPTQDAVRPRRAGHRGFRPQLPDRPPAAGARRAVRAGLERRRQRLPAPQLGLARRHRPRPRRRWAGAWTSPPPP